MPQVEELGDLRRERLEAAEAERRRWARELHDETLQGLAAVMLRLAAAREEHGAAAVEEAHALLHQEVLNLRALITNLCPRALDERGLEHALEALAAAAREDGLRVHTQLEITDVAEDALRSGGEQPASAVQIAVYRIAQEALNNVRKHACAREVIMRLHARGNTLALEVRDDGIGFDTRGDDPGFGLTSMRDNAQACGGVVVVRSARGAGASVKAIMPMQRRALTRASVRRGPSHRSRDIRQLATAGGNRD